MDQYVKCVGQVKNDTVKSFPPVFPSGRRQVEHEKVHNIIKQKGTNAYWIHSQYIIYDGTEVT